jgi:hypothetical protein
MCSQIRRVVERSITEKLLIFTDIFSIEISFKTLSTNEHIIPSIDFDTSFMERLETRDALQLLESFFIALITWLCSLDSWIAVFSETHCLNLKFVINFLDFELSHFRCVYDCEMLTVVVRVLINEIRFFTFNTQLLLFNSLQVKWTVFEEIDFPVRNLTIWSIYDDHILKILYIWHTLFKKSFHFLSV